MSVDVETLGSDDVDPRNMVANFAATFSLVSLGQTLIFDQRLSGGGWTGWLVAILLPKF